MNENEKQYYDKIVVLYGKYGENIPDADLMHLSVIEKELGISWFFVNLGGNISSISVCIK